MQLFLKPRIFVVFIALILVATLGMPTDLSARTLIIPPPGGEDEDNGDPGQGERVRAMDLIPVFPSLKCSSSETGIFDGVIPVGGFVQPMGLIPFVPAAPFSLSHVILFIDKTTVIYFRN